MWSTPQQSFRLLVPQEGHDRLLLMLMGDKVLSGFCRVKLALRQQEVLLGDQDGPEPEGLDDRATRAGRFVSGYSECTHGHCIIIKKSSQSYYL